jgi:vacuolar iron transporter family protein
MKISDEISKKLLVYQKNEITESVIYKKLAATVKGEKNKQVLRDIGSDEFRHYEQWKKYTNKDIQPDKFKVWLYYRISRIFGFTFGLKLMENGEEDAQGNYEKLVNIIPEASSIIDDENNHETELLKLLDEDRMRYTGSMVLGLNDALVELTGALAGLTLALQNTNLIALTGLITGIAAAMSMGASEYLSTKTEQNTKNPLKASLYTGATYLGTVVILILPYLLLNNYYLCLFFTLLGAVILIAIFNFYIATAKQESFKVRFAEMTLLSLSISALSFFIGLLLRVSFGIDV